MFPVPGEIKEIRDVQQIIRAKHGGTQKAEQAKKLL
jgi:hypothetical protein